MQRKDIRLSAIALFLALSGCVTVEIRDPEQESEAENAEAGVDPGLLGPVNPDAESPIGFSDFSDGGEDEIFSLEDPFAGEEWSLAT